MITNITYTDLATTELRDVGGRIIKVCKLQSIEGTYESGGIILDPSYFGLSNITYASFQSSTAMPLGGEGNPWTLVSTSSLMYVDSGLIYGGEASGNLDWRWVVSVAGEAGWEEFADGSDMTFPNGMAPVFMLIGETD